MPQPCRIATFNSEPIDYRIAFEWQRLLLDARCRNAVPDTLLLLEHTPVITIGRGSRDRRDLLASPADLSRHGIAVIETDRGGQMTYHAPGQLVGYPILDLDSRGRDLHKHLRNLEEVVISAVSEFGVKAERKSGLTGVWVGQRKICAIGVKVSHWITMHGFAVNVDCDMTPYRRDFIPCGIRDKGVASLKELGIAAGMHEVQIAIRRAFAAVFDVEPADYSENDIRALLSQLAMDAHPAANARGILET